jgi:hypothetical protein
MQHFVLTWWAGKCSRMAVTHAILQHSLVNCGLLVRHVYHWWQKHSSCKSVPSQAMRSLRSQLQLTHGLATMLAAACLPQI